MIPKPTKRILYVEDHEGPRDDFVAGCTNAAQGRNHEVKAPFAERRKAFVQALVEILSSDSTTWDALVLDVNLAGEMDGGIKLHDEIKSRFPNRWKHLLIRSRYAPRDITNPHSSDVKQLLEFIAREKLPQENVFNSFNSTPDRILTRIEELT